MFGSPLTLTASWLSMFQQKVEGKKKPLQVSQDSVFHIRVTTLRNAVRASVSVVGVRAFLGVGLEGSH